MFTDGWYLSYINYLPFPVRGEPFCGSGLSAVFHGAVQAVGRFFLHYISHYNTRKCPWWSPHVSDHDRYQVCSQVVFDIETQALKGNKSPLDFVVTTAPAPPTYLQVVNVTDTRALIKWVPSLGKVDRFIISFESSKSECGSLNIYDCCGKGYTKFCWRWLSVLFQLLMWQWQWCCLETQWNTSCGVYTEALCTQSRSWVRGTVFRAWPPQPHLPQLTVNREENTRSTWKLAAKPRQRMYSCVSQWLKPARWAHVMQS